MIIECPISLGELVDKMTILKIKTERIEDSDRVALAQSEYDQLSKKLEGLGLDGMDQYITELKEINEKLWVIEDDIRLKEKAGDFGESFISLARSVYMTNDLRFKVKNSINMSYNSGIKEVKSYK